MKRMKHLILALTIAAIPQTGHTFAATNGMTVEPVGGAVFEVSDGRGAPPPAYWCAAANYARRTLKASWQTKLYIVRTMGPSETTNFGSAVHFSADPAASGVSPAKGSSLGSYLVGENLSVQQANSYCR